jgi:hypothetical protein
MSHHMRLNSVNISHTLVSQTLARHVHVPHLGGASIALLPLAA